MSLEKVYYPNSQSVQYEWEKLPDGRKHGKGCEYYESGKLHREGEYHYNKEDGLWHEYDEKGNEIRQVKYEDGENKGWKEWDENHVLRSEVTFSGGKCVAYTNYGKDGVIKDKMYYDSDGVQHAEFYRKGQLDSTMLTYPDGTKVHKREEAPIRQALKEGQKKAHARDTVIQVKARQGAKRG